MIFLQNTLFMIFLSICIIYLFPIKKSRRIYAVCVFLIFLFLSIFFANEAIQIPLGGYFYNLCPIIFPTGMLIALIPALERKTITSVYIPVLWITDILTKLLLSQVFQIQFNDLNQPGYYYFHIYYFILFFLFQTILGVTYSFVIHRINLEENKTIYLLILSILCVEIICFFIINYQLSTAILEPSKDYGKIILINFILLFLFLITLITTILLYQKIQNKYKKINDYKEQLLYQHFNQIYKASQEELFKLKHDMANVIQSLDTQDIEIKNQLTQKLQSAPKIYFTEQKLLNTILVNKYQQAKIEQIETEFEIHIDTTPPLDKSDIISLLCNLLDNAIEATKISDDKQINLSLGITETELELSLINTYSTNQTPKHNPQYHGYGIKIIKDIVKKYKGIYHTEKTNNNFITYIKITYE